MCSATLTLPAAAMATKAAMLVVCCDICRPVHEAVFHALHAEWSSLPTKTEIDDLECAGALTEGHVPHSFVPCCPTSRT